LTEHSDPILEQNLHNRTQKHLIDLVKKNARLDFNLIVAGIGIKVTLWHIYLKHTQ
jgi:hypothetical protein